MREHTVVDLRLRRVRLDRPQLTGQVGDFGEPDVVGGQLGRGEQDAAPFACSLAILLVSAPGHQRHGLGFGHAVPVHPGVQDGVDDHAELHLELLHPDGARISFAGIAVLRHDLLGVDRPAFHE